MRVTEGARWSSPAELRAPILFLRVDTSRDDGEGILQSLHPSGELLDPLFDNPEMLGDRQYIVDRSSTE